MGQRARPESTAHARGETPGRAVPPAKLLAPASSTLLQLQRTVGNRAVTALLESVQRHGNPEEELEGEDVPAAALAVQRQTGIAKDPVFKGFVSGLESLKADWVGLSADQRLTRLAAPANASLTAVHVPEFKNVRTVSSPTTLGAFNRVRWDLAMNDKALLEPAASIPRVAATVYHEARHAEQLFRIARWLGANARIVNSRIDEADVTSLIESETEMPKDVAAAAARRPLKPKNATKWREAKLWYLNASTGATLGRQPPSTARPDPWTSSFAPLGKEKFFASYGGIRQHLTKMELALDEADLTVRQEKANFNAYWDEYVHVRFGIGKGTPNSAILSALKAPAPSQDEYVARRTTWAILEDSKARIDRFGKELQVAEDRYSEAYEAYKATTVEADAFALADRVTAGMTGDAEPAALRFVEAQAQPEVKRRPMPPEPRPPSASGPSAASSTTASSAPIRPPRPPRTDLGEVRRPGGQ